MTRSINRYTVNTANHLDTLNRHRTRYATMNYEAMRTHRLRDHNILARSSRVIYTNNVDRLINRSLRVNAVVTRSNLHCVSSARSSYSSTDT